MRFKFHPEARDELIEAALYYEGQRRNLGDEFLDEFDVAMAVVLDAPNRWPELEPGVRRYRLNRFPYGLIYRRIADEILEVVAVMELHRKPGYWRNRVTP